MSHLFDVACSPTYLNSRTRKIQQYSSTMGWMLSRWNAGGGGDLSWKLELMRYFQVVYEVNVKCRDKETAERFFGWLVNQGHVAEVVKNEGFSSAEVR